MELSWTLDERDGVTLVALRVGNDGPARRVRLQNTLDGPVWYPRRAGQPEAGWDEDGFGGRIPPGGRPLGYACPAPAREPPVEVRERGPAEAAAPTAAAALRELGDPRPPRDAVPDRPAEERGNATER